MSDTKTFTVDGIEYPFAQDLTLGEACDIHAIYGVKLGALEDLLSEGDAHAISATIYVSMRRVDPTIDAEAVRRVPLSVLATVSADLEADAGPPAGSADGE